MSNKNTLCLIISFPSHIVQAAVYLRIWVLLTDLQFPWVWLTNVIENPSPAWPGSSSSFRTLPAYLAHRELLNGRKNNIIGILSMSYLGECVPAFGEWGWGRDVCLVNYSWLLWHTWPFNRQISPSWALSDPANVHSKSPHLLPCPAFSIQTALRPLSVSACLREEGWFPCSQSPPVTSTPKFLLCDLVKVKNTFSRKVDTCHLHTNVTGWVKMWNYGVGRIYFGFYLLFCYFSNSVSL